LDVFNEEQLVVRCRAGDKSAYGELVKRHVRDVFAVCLGAVGNAADAEDLAQEAMVKGFMEIGRLRKGDSFGPWIRRIARNRSIDFLRHRQVGRDAVETLNRQCDTSQPTGDHASLEHALTRLDEKYRQAVLLYYFDGERTDLVAEKLEISPAAVLSRLSWARRQLRQLLAEQGDHDGSTL